MRIGELNPKILNHLVKNTDSKEGSIRSTISRWRSKYPHCTLNAVAQIYAQSKGITVNRWLSNEDRETLSHIEIEKQKIRVKQNQRKKTKRIITLIDYDTDHYFKKGHIQEINKAYTYGCYTSVYILTRKVVEGCVRDILVKKYPPRRKKNKELYYDIGRGRYKDFGVLLKVLFDHRHEFGPEKAKIIESLNDKAKKLSKLWNDAAHSWYHLVKNRREIDNLDIQYVIELIKKLEE